MTLMQPLQEIPKDIAHLLGERGLYQDYDVHPAYQRNGYLAQIACAKRPATRMRRTDQMLGGLETDDVCMRMRYTPSER